MTRPRGRLAPSPTGPLHAGNIRTFLIAWLSIRAASGALVLRVEDIDRTRCRSEYELQMLTDLHWLGFDWDEGPDTGGPFAPYRQHQRTNYYRSLLEQLAVAGWAYPCICSRTDLAAAASAPHGPGGTAYPGTCRDRFASGAAAAATGRPVAWRFDSRRCPHVIWRDGFVSGRELPTAVDDFVLWRADGVPSYQLAVVADDLAMGITEVVRGDDLLDSTPRQLALMRALGHTDPPSYFHVPLVLDDEGRRMAKREGATRISVLREWGAEPEAVIALLAATLWPADREAPVPTTQTSGNSPLAMNSSRIPLKEYVPYFSWGNLTTGPVTVSILSLNNLID